MSEVRISSFHAVLPPFDRTRPIWWRFTAGFVRRSQRLRRFFYELPRTRWRTAFVFRYYEDIIRDMSAGNIARHAEAIHPEAKVELFGMESFKGVQGAQEALEQWRQSFPGLEIEMAEFINPPGRHVICVSRLAGGGARSGAAVEQNLYFTIEVIEGMAVSLSLSEQKEHALAIAGLRAQ